MTLLASRSNRLNAVLAHEYAPEFGYCRKTATVTVASGMDVGAVLKLASGKWDWVSASEVATLPTDVAILVETEKDVTSLAAGDHTLTIMFRGPAGVKDSGLLFADTLTSGQQTTVKAALEAKGIAIRTGV